MPDALDQILKSYGIPESDIPAMRAAILSGESSISKEALSEAAQSAAGDEMNRLQLMTAMAKATKERHIDPAFYQHIVGDPGKRGIQEEAKLKAKEPYDNELLRLASMTDYLGDLSPRGGAITSGFREPGPGMLGLVPLEPGVRRTVGAAPEPEDEVSMLERLSDTPPVEVQVEQAPGPHVAQHRLRRALALRNAIFARGM